jgi:hypothetical protein
VQVIECLNCLGDLLVLVPVLLVVEPVLLAEDEDVLVYEGPS